MIMTFLANTCDEPYKKCMADDKCKSMLTEFLTDKDFGTDAPAAGIWNMDVALYNLDDYMQQKAADHGLEYWNETEDLGLWNTWTTFATLINTMKDGCQIAAHETRPKFSVESAEEGCVVDDRYYVIPPGAVENGAQCPVKYATKDVFCRPKKEMQEFCEGQWPSGKRGKWTVGSCSNTTPDSDTGLWDDDCEFSCEIPSEKGVV